MESLEPRLALAGDLLAATEQSMTFETFNQSMWGPNGPSIVDSGLLFAGAGWDASASPRLTDPLGTGSFIELNASTSGSIGIDFQAILDPGSIDASYGAQASLEVIEGDSNVFTINSLAVGSPTGSLETRSPNVDIESNFIFDFEAALGIQAQVKTPDIEFTVPTVRFENRTLFPGTIFQTTISVPIFGTRTVKLTGAELASFNEEIISLDIAESIELLKITNQEIRIVEQTVVVAEDGENLAFTFDLGFNPLTGLDVSAVEDGNPDKKEKPHADDPFELGVSFSMGDITIEVPTLNLAEDQFTTEAGALGLRTSGETNLARIDIDADFLASVLFGLPPLGASAGISVGPISLFEFAYDLLDVDIGPQFSIGQDFEFLPEILVTMGFSEPVVINGEEVTSHTMPVGSSVDVEFAGASTGEDLDITTSYSLANEFRNTTELLIAPSIDFLVLSASFETFLGTLFDEALFDPPAITGPAATLATLFNETYTLGGFGTIAGQTLNVDFNQPPEVHPEDLLLEATTVAEGSPVLLSGSFVDPDSGQTHTVVIDWGDGSAPTELALADDVKTFADIAHTYADDSPDPFTITVTVTDDQGEFDDATTSVIIFNAPPTATFSGPGTVTYGTAAVVEFTNPFDPSSADTAAGFRYAYAIDDAMALDGLTYADLGGSSASEAFDLDAGAYTIYGRIFDKDDGLTQHETQVIVSPASLTITADHQTKVYGDADPTLTFDASGFQLGDQAVDVLSGGLERATGENVGSYAINQGTLTAGSNYTIAFTGHDLAITPAPLTVAADDAQREYGDPNLTFTGSIVGIKNDDAISAGYSTSATPTSNIGDYPIVPSLNDPDNRLGNYDLTINDGTLTVTPATLTVNVDDAPWQIRSPFPTFNGTLSGEKNGESFSALYSSVADETSTVGQYAITAQVSGATLSNYLVVVNEGTLTVTPAQVQIDIRPESLNIDSSGAISLVIFGSTGFDVSLLDLDRLAFAGVEISLFQHSFADIDGDGNQDLLLHFGMTDELQDALKDIYAGLPEENYEGGSTFKQPSLLALDGFFGQYDQEFTGSDSVDMFLSGRSLRSFLQSLGIG